MADQRANPARRLRPTVDAASSPSRRAPNRRAHREREWQVIDELPRPRPIGRAEIEVLEIYLGTQIDDILRKMRGQK